MMDGSVVQCGETDNVHIVLLGRHFQHKFIVSRLPDRYELIIGMDLIARLGGLVLGVEENACHVAAQDIHKDIEIEDVDFIARFSKGSWVLRWKWVDNPPTIVNTVAGYKVPDASREQFDEEIDNWISNKWLVPYEGEVKCLLPFMAIYQHSKSKVRPVLDYRILNPFISSHTADSDVCADTLRKWRRMGDELTLLELRKAYLQIKVDSDMWKYQVVRYKGKQYALTRLGFGLNVAPRVMRTIVQYVLKSNPEFVGNVDAYVDDVMVNHSKVKAEVVQQTLMLYGLESKPGAIIQKGAKVLGLKTEDHLGTVQWTKGVEINDLDSDEQITKRSLFSFLGKLTGHFPVCSWLRVACSFLKRSAGNAPWDSPISTFCHNCLREIFDRLRCNDPVRGLWHVPPSKQATVWVDASAIAIGALVEMTNKVVEDGCWLCGMRDYTHINLAELDAVLRGVSMALKWNSKKLTIMTDSPSVCGWVKSMLERDKPVRVRKLSEVLVYRRLQLLRLTAEECGLEIDIRLVPSSQNKADVLTRVPKRWHSNESNVDKGNELTSIACVARGENGDGGENDDKKIIQLVHNYNHFGADRTLYFLKLYYPTVDADRTKFLEVIRDCPACLRIDPQAIQVSDGSL